MAIHELCPTCQPHGKCLFERYAKTLTGHMPPREKQTVIDAETKITSEAVEMNKTLSKLRIMARDLGCPKINEVNPDYPGKKSL